LDTVQEFQLPARHHGALVEWQHRNFPDLPILQKYWAKSFPRDNPYRLCARVAALTNPTIELGLFKGKSHVERASDMRGNMLYSALRIVRAQCSTELGSIQQHLDTLDSAVSDPVKFSILRICAEELRHAYQMFWVLSHDDSWAQAGIHDIANQTLDELLAMTTGTHVLDAFNIPFYDPLDNMVFAFLIDRVGKYQLSMQKVFAYAPMARSMPPMLQEESFHLKTGYELVREAAIRAAQGEGRWSLDEIQRRLNSWFPRGVEMFGNPEGGQANIDFSFKDRLNGESLNAYVAEVGRLLHRINVGIVMARHPGLDKADAEARAGGEDDLLRLPHVNYFRLRGTDDIAYQPIDVRGRRLSGDAYRVHLGETLPASLLSSGFFTKYQEALARTGI
jgi:1,2-phenylacetyl-CoA epoxidase catalytic subunit